MPKLEKGDKITLRIKPRENKIVIYETVDIPSLIKMTHNAKVY